MLKRYAGGNHPVLSTAAGLPRGDAHEPLQMTLYYQCCHAGPSLPDCIADILTADRRNYQMHPDLRTVTCLALHLTTKFQLEQRHIHEAYVPWDERSLSKDTEVDI